MEVSSLSGKRFTVLLMGTTPDGKDDWAVFPGIARVDDEGLTLPSDTNEEDLLMTGLKWPDSPSSQ